MTITLQTASVGVRSKAGGRRCSAEDSGSFRFATIRELSVLLLEPGFCLSNPLGEQQLGEPDSGNPVSSGGRLVLEFLQTRYSRGLRQLREFSKRDATVTDIGVNDSSRVAMVLEENGESTKYTLDTAKPRMAQFEIVRGQSRDLAGITVPAQDPIVRR